MDIVQPPVSDVIKETLLTTIGDIVVRGAVVPERLGIGSALRGVRVNAAGNALEYAPQMIMLPTLTLDPITVTGTVNGTYTIGPTGSGADIINTSFDAIPAGAIYVMVAMRAYLAHGTGFAGINTYFAQFFYNDANNYMKAYVQVDAYGQNTISYDCIQAILPLDANRKIKMTYNKTLVAGASANINIGAIGFIM